MMAGSVGEQENRAPSLGLCPAEPRSSPGFPPSRTTWRRLINGNEPNTTGCVQVTLRRADPAVIDGLVDHCPSADRFQVRDHVCLLRNEVARPYGPGHRMLCARRPGRLKIAPDIAKCRFSISGRLAWTYRILRPPKDLLGGRFVSSNRIGPERYGGDRVIPRKVGAPEKTEQVLTIFNFATLVVLSKEKPRGNLRGIGVA